MIAQREPEVPCTLDGKTTGCGIDNLYILAAGDQSPKSHGIALQTMKWSQDYDPPLFTDVLDLLCSTLQIITPGYSATE